MKINRGLVSGATDLLVLSLISERDMYGYEIIAELEKKSKDVFQFKEGTLYPILHKLENKGYLKSYKSQGDAGRKRKYYQITRQGKKQLLEEKEQWEVFSESINTIIVGEEYGLA